MIDGGVVEGRSDLIKQKNTVFFSFFFVFFFDYFFFILFSFFSKIFNSLVASLNFFLFLIFFRYI